MIEPFFSVNMCVVTTFNDFHHWLFPGDDLSMTRNPSAMGKLPAGAREILEEVSCKTGVEVEWLAASARLVLQGLAGARCLWFLHGARGTIDVEEEWEDTCQKIPTAYESDIQGIIYKLTEKQIALGNDTKLVICVDWYAGVVEEEIFKMRGPGSSWDKPVKRREIRLGKWLRKHKASHVLIKAFETRQLPHFEWVISCHPYDVLTMSFNRPWISCMRPGGAAELGPLTDMAAGSAVMFFHRPGANQPCGRILLRPVVENDGHPAIIGGGVVHGVGPGKRSHRFGHDVTLLGNADLKPVLDPIIEPGGVKISKHVGLCDYGYKSQALTRNIYSDTNNAYCTQEDGTYDDAYANLVGLLWPDVKLDLGDFAARAGDLVEGVDAKPTRQHLREIAVAIADGWTSQDGGSINEIKSAIRAAGSGDIPTSEDYQAFGIDPGSQTARNIDSMLIDILKEMLQEKLDSVGTNVFVIPDDVEDESMEDLIRATMHESMYLIEELPGEVYFATVWHPRIRNIHENMLNAVNFEFGQRTGDTEFDISESGWLLWVRPEGAMEDVDYRRYDDFKKDLNKKHIVFHEFDLQPGEWDWSDF